MSESGGGRPDSGAGRPGGEGAVPCPLCTQVDLGGECPVCGGAAEIRESDPAELFRKARIGILALLKRMTLGKSGTRERREELLDVLEDLYERDSGLRIAVERLLRSLDEDEEQWNNPGM